MRRHLDAGSPPNDPGDDPSVLVEGPSGAVRLWFQQVPEPKKLKNRVHVDVGAADFQTELRRLVGLGATVVQERESLTALADPEGNEFCLVRPE